MSPMNVAKKLMLNVLRSGGAPAFSPLDISGLALWLDASDSATLFQASDGTTPATADGDVVGYWGDKSGGGFHTRQTTTASKPALKLAVQNGCSALLFDGTDDFLTAGDVLDMGTNSLTLFVVAKRTASGQTLVAKATAEDIPRYALTAYGERDKAIIYEGLGGVNEAAVFGWVYGAFEVETAVINRNAGSVVLRSNGTDIAATVFTPDASDSLDNALPLLIGAYSAGDTLRLNGHICEVVLYLRPTALTAGEIGEVEAYLMTKWGLS